MAQRMASPATDFGGSRRWASRLRGLRARVVSTARTIRSCESGTAAIEFALMAPFLVVLIGGVVEFGSAMYEAMQANAAVDAGILYIAANDSAIASNVAGSLSAIDAAVANATQLPAAYPGGVTPNASAVACPSGTSGTCVQVKASINHLILLPTSFGLPNTLTAIAVIRVQ